MELREQAKQKPVDLLAVLEEAHSFVNRHSESWYYSGQELLGLLDGAIAAVRAERQ
jgi:hypothetical protein